MVCVCFCLLVTSTNCAETAEPVEMPFGYGLGVPNGLWREAQTLPVMGSWGHLVTHCEVWGVSSISQLYAM